MQMLLCYAISEFDASHSTVGKQTAAATTAKSPLEGSVSQLNVSLTLQFELEHRSIKVTVVWAESIPSFNKTQIL